MNKEQIIDEVYENYKIHIQTQRDLQKKEVERLRSQGKRVRVSLIELLSKEEFINKCKTDTEFSQKWGLKIEERELSLDERYDLCAARKSKMTAISEEDYIKYNIPTKLITITYKEQTIESYE